MTGAIFFITGTSGAGKTSLLEHLAARLDNCKIHDIDEDGVPQDADVNWRRSRTNELLLKAIAYQRADLSTVILGQTVPTEVMACSSYERTLPVHYGCIHIDEHIIRERLSARGWQSDTINDNINWAQVLEGEVKAQEGSLIVDGVENSASEVADKFIHWIESYSR